ncbi:hypothetical protein GCM10010172_87460 [Paractinoplanes ferrugineus]|uniref:Uncharacterized protein n=1 Tax=Paractinoplanes ferrugineus TaxID=113564 RepID=A0A919JG08_9ACTN|nr:hypothetical protein [Actinoplanes ferrugineus]GIE16521.1 hypothetical protein Afe05nite_83610 [Actinoplanes ferrugineus]
MEKESDGKDPAPDKVVEKDEPETPREPPDTLWVEMEEVRGDRWPEVFGGGRD